MEDLLIIQKIEDMMRYGYQAVAHFPKDAITIHAGNIPDLSSIYASAYTELIKPNSITLSTSECNNTLINNYGQSDNITYILPIPEANLSFYLFISTEGFEITLDDGDNSITLDNLEQYDLFKIYTVKTGTTEYSWIVEKRV